MDMQAQAAKPENALRRAEELLSQEQPVRALGVLTDVIGNKRYRTWQGSTEDVMMKLLQLCVDLRRGKQARDALHQYRSICQQVNAHSLEKVIHFFVDTVETKAKEAQQTSAEEAAKLLDGQELDDEGRSWGDDTPESLVMKAVSGESAKDRTDRELVLPWVRFLWESYRTSMDVCRNNKTLEIIYHDTVKKALNFCKAYQRKSEFRRLTDTVRYQSQAFIKTLNPEQRHALYNSQESFTRYIETRFKQLQVATALDMWQEAYKSIEDIHNVIHTFRKTPSPKLKLEYFDKLAKVFKVSNNRLFHAHASSKYYHSLVQINTTKTNTDADECTLAASKVVLSALSVPFWHKENTGRQREELFESNITHEKNVRLSTLLGSKVIPTRYGLISELVTRGVLDQGYPQLKPLYQALEVDFNPLQLCSKVKPVLDFISENPAIESFVQPLKEIAVVRMLEQLCHIYSRMKISDLIKLVPYYSFAELEPLLVSVAQSGYGNLRLTISHHTSSICFTDQATNGDSLSALLPTMLNQFAPVTAMCKSATAPRRKATTKPVEFYQKLKGDLEAERERILQRKIDIQERNALLEQHYCEMEQKRKDELKERQDQMKAQEEDRLKREADIRDRKRAQEETIAKQEEQTKRLFDIVNAGKKKAQQPPPATAAEAAAAKPTPVLDHDKLYEQAKQKLIRQKEQKEQRLADEFKKVDFLERACREDERDLLLKRWQTIMEKKKTEAKTRAIEDQEEMKTIWENALKEKKRLSRMETYIMAFKEETLKEREKVWEQHQEEERERESQMEEAELAEKRAAEEERRRQEAEEEAQREEEQRAAEKAAEAAKPKPKAKPAYVPPSQRKK